MTSKENQSLNNVSTRSARATRQSTNLLSRETLLQRLASSPEARCSFVESNLSKLLAYQIRAMREREGWTQIELGDEVEMNQNSISRLENPFYGKHTITTLKRLARAFDVALVVRFTPFSELVDWISGTPRTIDGLNQNALNVPKYSEERSEQVTSSLQYPKDIAELLGPNRIGPRTTPTPTNFVKQSNQLGFALQSPDGSINGLHIIKTIQASQNPGSSTNGIQDTSIDKVAVNVGGQQ
jgi:transcriptional regulator with XRE-family HTH domain